MTSWLIAGFMLGAVGSLHCVGMCGPLALSLPAVNDRPMSKLISTYLYHTGRILMYGVIGLLAGLAGRSAAFFGFQQWFSLILGIIILLFMLFPFLAPRWGKAQPLQHFFEVLRNRLGKLYFKKTYTSTFTIGLLNGLLPCGMVYIAMAGAVSAGSLLNSSLFMMLFGLGTLPVMWSMSFFGSFIQISWRQRMRKLYPYIMFFMACLLIVRGMGWGIPYLSPALEQDIRNGAGTVSCH
jgi:sulfite exporter TauE/SafE